MGLFSSDNWAFEMEDSDIPIVSEIDLSYIAGIVDGEGCITSSQNKKGVTVECIIRTKDNIILPYIYRILGFGSFKFIDKIEQFQLRFTGNNLILFLVLIFPFLKLKKEQANLVLELMCIRKSSSTQFCNDSVNQARISESVRKLNQRFRS